MNRSPRDLSKGLRGQDVKHLQNRLKKLGFDIPDNEFKGRYFGLKTEEAVRKFQIAYSLEANGVVDRESTIKLRNLTSKNTTGRLPQSPYSARSSHPATHAMEVESSSRCVVRGRVLDAGSQPLPGGIIRAFDVQLRVENLLGETTTHSDGYYSIGYIPTGSNGLNLRVTAYDTYNKELASSAVHYCTGDNETIDLSIDRDAYHGLSEYEILESEIIPLLRNASMSLADLTENEEHEDITFLSGKTGRPPLHIAFLSLGHRFRRDTNLPAEVWYGLLRQDLSTSLKDILRQSPELQRRALEAAIKDNIIPLRFGVQLDDILAHLGRLIIRRALDVQEQGHPGSAHDQSNRANLGQLVSTVLSDRTKQEVFLSDYLSNAGKPITEFWMALKSKSEFKNYVEDLEFAFHAATLTNNYLPLIQELQRMKQAGEISSIRDLAGYDEKDWQEIISRPNGRGSSSNLDTSSIIGFPSDTPGGNDHEKSTNYTLAMAQMVEDISPTKFIARRLEREIGDSYSDDSSIPGRQDLITFMNANPEFDFRHAHLDEYLARKPDALTNISDLEGTKTRIKTMQRIYRLAGRYDKMMYLLKAGVGSAHAIARMGENTFTAMYGNALGGPLVARAIHKSAMDVQAKAISLLADLGIPSYRVPMSALPDATLTEVDGVPEWSTLFGSLDLCECERCRSVLGPTAYLVDLLRFLKDRPSKIQGKYAKDILLERRPDIGEIELTCENANTLLPYVDLVNEILENAVWPFPRFSSFTLRREREAELNRQFVSVDLRNSFNPPLSDDALISVGGQGEPWTPDEPWWTIDDLAFTYTIRKIKSDNKLHVVSRSLQTKGSVSERGANPQYVNAMAYEVLKESVYPWKSLPFDLWCEETHTYLQHVGVRRSQIMETFRQGERKTILSDPVVAQDYLGISAQEADLITGKILNQHSTSSPKIWNLWGFEAETLDLKNSIPDPSDSTRRITTGNWLNVITGRVDVFLQQSGLNYQELLDLLDTLFVNPLIEVSVGGGGEADNKRKVRTMQITSTDPNDPYTCETAKLQLTGFDGVNTSLKIMRFVRLWRKLDAEWTMRELDRTITALRLGPGAVLDDIPNDLLIMQISHIKRLCLILNLPVTHVLSFWAPIDTQSYYVDHASSDRPKIQSLYAQLFRDKTASDTLYPAFTEEPCDLSNRRGNPPEYPTLAQHAEAISSSLKISASDFHLLLTHLDLLLNSPSHAPSCPPNPNDPPRPVDVLSLDNLSCLYRHSILAQALNLSIQDYLLLLKLTESDHHEPFTSTTDTVLFIEDIKNVKTSPFTLPELDYLLLPLPNGTALPPSSSFIAPSEEAIAALLDEIRIGLQQQTLSEASVKQKIAENLALEYGIADELLTHYVNSWAHPGNRSIEAFVPTPPDFLAREFAESSPDVKLTRETFPLQFNTFSLLHKIAIVIRGFKISKRELLWIFEYASDVSWLDLNKLPIISGEHAGSFESWLRLVDLFRLRDRLPLGTLLLDEIFRLAQPGGTTLEILSLLSARTGWGLPDLENLEGALGLSLVKFKDERALGRLWDCFSLINGLKMSARQCLDLSKDEVTREISRGVRQSIRARYAGTSENKDGEDGWLNVAKPLRDLLREKQRAALVEYLVTHLKIPFPILETPHPNLDRDDPDNPVQTHTLAIKELQQKLNASGIEPPQIVDGNFSDDTFSAVKSFQEKNALQVNGKVGPETWSVLDSVNQSIRDRNDLYAYFLIDVEMSPCMIISRVKLALSSIQLFVQRCMLGLERQVEASTTIDERWDEWNWMKNYRVWESNRNVFLYPENWIEPELRNDKSPFFSELESQLMQGELSDEVVENAVEEYLMKLDQVARLEIMGIYRQIGDDPSGNADTLHVFGRTLSEPYIYYYRQQKGFAHWTAWEKVDLEIEGNHLAPVVWNRRLYLFWAIFERIQENTGGTITQYSKLKIAWSVRQQNGWAPKRVSFTYPNELAPEQLEYQIYNHRLSCRIDPYNNLHVGIIYAWRTTEPTSEVKGFAFNDGISTPIVVKDVIPRESPPENTIYEYNFLMEQTSEGDDVLYLPAYADTSVLTTTPHTFYLLPPNDGTNLFDHPSFFMDNTRTFFISPVIPTFMRHWWKADEIDPSFVSYIAANYHTSLKPFQGNKVSSILPELSGAVAFGASSQKIPNSNKDSSTMLPAVRGASRTSVTHSSTEGGSIGIFPNNATDLAENGAPLSRTDTPYKVDSDFILSDSTGLVTHSQLRNGNSIAGRSQALVNLALSEVTYQFETFYHPYLPAFTREFNRRGIDGLFERSIQIKPMNPIPILEWPHPVLRPDLVPVPNRPAVKEVERKLNAWGKLPGPLNVDGIYGPDTQGGVRIFQEANRLSPDAIVGPETWSKLDVVTAEPFDFSKVYSPTFVVKDPYPIEEVDFKYGNPYSLYNWELFFHVPLLIADRLSKSQQFEKAQRWFHRIFNPTVNSDGSIPQRYWQTRPFYETLPEDYQNQKIQRLFKLLAVGNDPEKYQELDDEEKRMYNEFRRSIVEWRKNPFEPHSIARNRTTSYQKCVVMKYLDNLIAWGDQLFRRETIESINEATQLYILAAEILGHRPEETSLRATRQAQTYNSLEPELDEFSNALIQIEDFISPSGDESGSSEPRVHPTLVTLPAILQFCVPKNDRLLGYWDLVADRLFKVRHCMNIQGTIRQLPLFEQPIDPTLLLKAAESGIDIDNIFNDINPALPNYRFGVLVQKASELSSELKSLGSALLGAIEKKDAEELSLIRAEQEVSLLRLLESVKEQQVGEANQNLVALFKSRDIAQANYIYYGNLLREDPQLPKFNEEIRERFHKLLIRLPERPDPPVSIFDFLKMKEFLIALALGEEPFVEGEELVTKALMDAVGKRFAAANMDVAASVAESTPYVGTYLSAAIRMVSNKKREEAEKYALEAELHSKLVDRRLRAHEWNLKFNLAAKEIMYIDKQITVAEIRLEIAKQELSNHLKQIENARQVQDFMRTKYTNQELYGWMIGQVTAIYFQSYQLAYDVAMRAETAYRFELGLSDSNFIQFGYWDSLKRGLLTGEGLYSDIKRMEVAYLDQNQREYEIIKHVSLSRLDPLALAQLKQTGECFVSVPEALFDLDYPGHFLRRIKYASLTIPCVTGPYTGVNCTLTLLKSSIRHSTSLGSPPEYRRHLEEEDPRFRDNIGAIQSIVTSSGQNDSGLFDTNLRDERYLPFEGSGVISEWHIQLPKDFRQFDYDTISDVVLHIRYTAREGGEPLKNLAAQELNKAMSEFLRTEGEKGLALPISLRHEFPSEWHRFLNPPQDADKPSNLITMNLSPERFPFMFQGRTITINIIEMFLKIKPKSEDTHNETTLKLTLEPVTDPPTTPHDLRLTKWNGLLRAEPSGHLDGGLGNWILTAWRGTDDRLDPNAVEDILVVCTYSL